MIILLKAINFSVAQFKLAGVDCLYTIKGFDFDLCYDLCAAFMYELDEAFKSSGLFHSQIDTVFALGGAKDNRIIREILQHLFPNKVQFEQTDAERRNSIIMERWQCTNSWRRQYGFQTRHGIARPLSGIANALNCAAIKHSKILY